MKIVNTLSAFLIIAGFSFCLAEPNKTIDTADILRESFKPISSKPKTSDSELGSLIDDLNNLTLPGKRKKRNKPSANIPVKNNSKKIKLKSKPKIKSSELDNSILAQIKDNLPANILDALNIADNLFAANKKQYALEIYKLYLPKLKDDEIRSWVLYQLGCCLEKIDSEKSIEYFKQLQKEFPKSSWSKTAKLKIKMVRWLAEHRPDEVLSEAEQLLDNSADKK